MNYVEITDESELFEDGFKIDIPVTESKFYFSWLSIFEFHSKFNKYRIKFRESMLKDTEDIIHFERRKANDVCYEKVVIEVFNDNTMRYVNISDTETRFHLTLKVDAYSRLR
jgi:hypothetical protein